MPNEIINGMKYFRLVDNSMNIIRITSGLNPMKIRAKNVIDGKNIFLNKDELKTYTRLNPDALIQFSILNNTPFLAGHSTKPISTIANLFQIFWKFVYKTNLVIRS